MKDVNRQKKQDAVGDGRLRNRCCHPENSTKHTRRLWFWPIRSMTSPAKPKVHGILHCRQRRTEPRPRVTCTENLAKFGHVFFRYAREQTNRQTHTHTLIAIIRTHSGSEVNTHDLHSAFATQIDKTCKPTAVQSTARANGRLELRLGTRYLPRKWTTVA